MKTNVLALRAEKFIGRCSCIWDIFGEKRVRLSWVLNALPHITLEKEYSLECLMPKHEGLGGTCTIYSRKKRSLPPSRSKLNYTDGITCATLDPSDPSLREYVPQLHMTVENSPEGIWEFFLFSRMWQFLPLWWHAGYSRIEIITDADKLLKIAHISKEMQHEYTEKGYIESLIRPENESRRGLTNEKVGKALKFYGDERLLPSVKINGTEAMITYSFWSEWGGLIRKRIKVINTNEIPKFEENPETESLISYSCGIMY